MTGRRAVEPENRLDDGGDPQRGEDDQPVDQPGRRRLEKLANAERSRG
jgi:hypothetical protein